MATREVYIDKMAAQLKKWSAKLDVMEAKAGSAAGKVKAGFIKQVKLLKKKEQAAVTSLTKFKESTVDAGGEIAGGVEKAWNDFKEAMHSAGDKFNHVK